MNDFHLEVALEIGVRNFQAQVTEAYVLNTVVESLKNLFGEVAAAIPLRIEKFERESKGAKFIIQCQYHSYVKLRSSLTLHNKYQSLPCAFHVTRIGKTLLDLQSSKPLII